MQVYSDDSADLDFLRALCERQRVVPEDADLEAVQGFLRAILPALAELEQLVPDDLGTVP
jgi:hypothetical protein